MSMSVANLGGRLAWASLSDYIGRKNVFVAFFALGIPLFLATPYLVSWVCACLYFLRPLSCVLCINSLQVSANPGMLPLALFYGSTLVIISIFGAAYACMPAYEADLFGTKYCGAVHGRMLTASAVASGAQMLCKFLVISCFRCCKQMLCLFCTFAYEYLATGPTTMTLLRSRSETNAIMELAAKVDPEIFYQRFGVQIQNLEELIQAKTVTIKNVCRDHEYLTSKKLLTYSSSVVGAPSCRHCRSHCVCLQHFVVRCRRSSLCWCSCYFGCETHCPQVLYG